MYRVLTKVVICIFQGLLQEKDYLNGRVLHKRAYYLAVIASAITGKKSGLNVDVSYGTVHGDPRLTCLILRSKAGNYIVFNFALTHYN